MAGAAANYDMVENCMDEEYEEDIEMGGLFGDDDDDFGGSSSYVAPAPAPPPAPVI